MKVSSEIPKDVDGFSVRKVDNAELVFSDEKSDWIEVRFLDEETRRYRVYSIKREWLTGDGQWKQK